MKLLTSFSFAATLALVTASIWGVSKGLSLFCFCLGLKTLAEAKAYHANQQKGFAAASLGLGIFACVCALLSVIPII